MAILDRFIENDPFDDLKPVVTAEDIIKAGDESKKIFVHKCVRQYIVDIVQTSRTHSRSLLGASPRSALALLRASQVYAAITGSDFVTPDHIKLLCKPVLSHRILLSGGNNTMKNTEAFIEELIGSVAAPTEDWEQR